MWGDIWTAEYDTEPYDTEMHDPVIIDYANQPRTDVLQAGKLERLWMLNHCIEKPSKAAERRKLRRPTVHRLRNNL